MGVTDTSSMSLPDPLSEEEEDMGVTVTGVAECMSV